MLRRRIAISLSLMVLALLLAASGVLLFPSTHDLVVPIDRSALDMREVKKEPPREKPDTKSKTVTQSQALTSSPDPRLIEKTPNGLLPRKADNGERPADVYARPFDKVRMTSPLPKLSIVILGAGMSETVTAEAYLAMPADVSFALSPYADDAERQARDIRNRGHEVFLEVQSKADPSRHEDRGPYALDPALATDLNRERLHWMMSRFTGYVGFINDLTPAAHNTAALRDLIAGEVKTRGLTALSIIRPDSQTSEMTRPDDDRPSRVSLLYARTPAALTTVLDAIRSTLADDREHVLLIDPSPLALDALKEWIVTHGSHEFDLVPLSALMRLEGQG